MQREQDGRCSLFQYSPIHVIVWLLRQLMMPPAYVLTRNLPYMSNFELLYP